MITDILNDTGVQYARGRFLRMPEETHAVYFDDIDVSAADRTGATGAVPRIITHNITVELYEAAPDDAAEAAIESALDARGISWEKQDRYWVQGAQRYQVVYEFTYTEKSK